MRQKKEDKRSKKRITPNPINLNKRILKTAFVMLIALAILFVIANNITTKDPEYLENIEGDFSLILPSDVKVPNFETVQLYFKYAGEEYLASESREIQVGANERIESAVVLELAKGPSNSKPELERVVSQKTTVTKIEERGDTLYLTLSYNYFDLKNFLTQGVVLDDDQSMLNSRLSLYSIINTITGMGKYSKVLILIDEGNQGSGLRYPRSRFGFADKDEALPIEPMIYESGIVFTPKKLVEIVMNAVMDQDWDALVSYLTKASASQVRQKEDILADMERRPEKIESFEVLDIVVGKDGRSAVAWLEIRYAQTDGTIVTRESVPFAMQTEGEIWKIAVEALQNITQLPEI